VHQRKYPGILQLPFVQKKRLRMARAELMFMWGNLESMATALFPENGSRQEPDLLPAAHKQHPGKEIQLYGGDNYRGGKGSWRVTVWFFHDFGFRGLGLP
jgi:hypothetical protein